MQSPSEYPGLEEDPSSVSKPGPMLYETIHFAGVQLYLFEPPKGSFDGSPVVFALHGRGGRAQNMFPLCQQLCAGSAAPVCVTFDLPNHGQRQLDRHMNDAWDKGNLLHAEQMYSQMLCTVRFLSCLIDELPSLLSFRPGSFALTGFSQGGHTTLLATVLEPRFVAFLPFIGSGDYLTNMEVRYARLQKKEGADVPPWGILMPLALRECLKLRDPINNVASIAETHR